MGVARVQNLFAYYSTPLPFASNNTAGNVLAAGVFSASATPPVVTDSQSNTWHLALTQLAPQDPNSRTLHLYYALNCAGGANIVSVATDGADVVLCIAEYSGLPATLTPQFSSASSASGNAYDAGSLTVATAAAFFGIVSGRYGGVTNTPANGFTDIATAVSYYFGDDLIASVGGATDYSGDISGAGSTGWAAAVIAFPSVAITHSISGNAGIAGATVTLSGAASAATTADGSGNYSFAGLSAGSFTVTPTRTGYTFSPASANETVVAANITGVSFTASAIVSGARMITLSGGEFQNAQDVAIANGSILLSLNSDEQVVMSPYGQVMSGVPITIPLDANGSVLGTPKIFSNAELFPSGSSYDVVILDKNGARVNRLPVSWIFTQAAGSTVNLSGYTNSYPPTFSPILTITGVPTAGQVPTATSAFAATWSSPAGGITPTPAWFNVKNYGAKGDARQVDDAVSSGTNTLTSATANFTAADVGKVVWAIEAASGIARVAVGTVATVASATQITVTTSAFAQPYINLTLVLGTDDTAALRAAYQAACILRTGQDMPTNLPTVYCPAGGYIISAIPFYPSADGLLPIGQLPIPSILGDGPHSTMFYPSPAYSFAAPFAAGFGMLNLNFGTGASADNEIGNFGVNCSGFAFNTGSNGFLVDGSGARYIHDIVMQDTGLGALTIGGLGATEGSGGGNLGAVWERVIGLGLNSNGPAISINGGSATMIKCSGSNGYCGIQIINVNNGTSHTDNGAHVTLIGCMEDEGGPNVTQVQFVNSSSVSIHGGNFLGGAASLPCSVDATSDISFFGVTIGPFYYRNNADALHVLAGGTARLFGCRIHATGTGVGLTVGVGAVVYASNCDFRCTPAGKDILNNGTIYDGLGNLVDASSISGSGTISQKTISM